MISYTLLYDDENAFYGPFYEYILRTFSNLKMSTTGNGEKRQ